MSLTDLTARWAFLIVLTITLSGCGPIVIPLPPPIPTATSFVQTDPGDLSVDAGIAAVAVVSSSEILGTGAPGGLPLTLAYGLGDRVELSTTGAIFSAGRVAGAQVGVRAVDRDRVHLGVVLGTGVYAVQASYLETQEVTDANGSPVLDADGNPTYQSVDVPYGYWGLAPNVGLRGSIDLSDRVALAGYVRGSMSRTFPWYGVSESEMRTQSYSEVGLGVVAHPTDGLEIGAGVTTIGAQGAFAPGLRPTLSVRGSFPTR